LLFYFFPVTTVLIIILIFRKKNQFGGFESLAIFPNFKHFLVKNTLKRNFQYFLVANWLKFAKKRKKNTTNNR